MYHCAVAEITAFVLAGGQSSRMGKAKDKAFLMLADRSLLDRALALAGSLTSDVRISGSAVKFARFSPVVEDIYPQQGPLSGIHAALQQSASELNLMLAVDLPFVEPGFLRYLVAQARASKALATVPQTPDGWQPLCAVYRREFAKIAESALREGRNRIDALFLSSITHPITGKEMINGGFSLAMFRNLNTPEELQAANDGWKKGRPNLNEHS